MTTFGARHTVGSANPRGGEEGLSEPMADDLRRTPQQDRSRRSLDAILDATAALLAETEPSSLTMSAIGDRAGVSKAAIYRYYPDRPAVIRALAQRYLEPLGDLLAERLEGGGSEAAVDAYADYLEAEPVVKAIWITGYSHPEVGGYCAEFDRRVATRVAAQALDDTSEETVQRIVLVLRAVRSALEFSSLDGAAGTPDVIAELKAMLGDVLPARSR